MDMSFLFAVLLLSPLVGFLINGSFRNKLSANAAGAIATVASTISFIASVVLFNQLLNLPPESRRLAVEFFSWINVGDFNLPMGFVIDQMSGIMILIITGVGSLIHLFSIGYMHHDNGAPKYFSYLNLFLFNMLILVLADNLLVLFVGWEGVGLCSYLLIGFWYKDAAKANAGMKAFITNRIGDAFVLLGMFLLFFTFGTLSFSTINSLVPTTPELSWMSPMALATLFLFIGATGKSAQAPLYVWLPDAMAGPTPVSALIHAATMVTAGVYLICRLNPLFLATPNTMMVIAIVGVITAVGAALIGLTQWDIKKVLAYSTVSQLGFMFIAVGVGAFTAAMFHLMTHAFFKALMFLGSGSVIHAMHEEQDIRKMGGLKKYLPITHWTFVFGWIAIIGIPPLAGFFSKDEILWYSFHSPLGSTYLWILGLFGAGVTAFYMTRLMCLTFWGKPRFSDSVHPHEAPASMAIPLVVLGVLSIVGGWIGIPHVIGGSIGHIPNYFSDWLAPLIMPIPNITEANHTLELVLMALSVVVASASAFTAYYFYLKAPHIPGLIANRFQKTYRFIENKYFVDEFYFSKIINPLVKISDDLWQHFDVKVVDKTTYFISDVVKSSGQLVRSLQTGNIQQYAMYIAIGIVVTLSLIIMR